jgi:hypothetical protein
MIIGDTSIMTNVCFATTLISKVTMMGTGLALIWVYAPNDVFQSVSKGYA